MRFEDRRYLGLPEPAPKPGTHSLDEQRKIARRRREAMQSIDRDFIFRRDGHRCQYCGTVGVPLALDHVVPFSRGGETTPENLVAACKRCNSRKKDRTPEEAGLTIRGAL